MPDVHCAPRATFKREIRVAIVPQAGGASVAVLAATTPRSSMLAAPRVARDPLRASPVPWYHAGGLGRKSAVLWAVWTSLGVLVTGRSRSQFEPPQRSNSALPPAMARHRDRLGSGPSRGTGRLAIGGPQRTGRASHSHFEPGWCACQGATLPGHWIALPGRLGRPHANRPTPPGGLSM